MNTMPVIDMTATGRNIVRLRKQAGMTVRDLQNVTESGQTVAQLAQPVHLSGSTICK